MSPEDRIKEAIEKSQAGDQWVNVSFMARVNASGEVETTQPAVRLPWIPQKSK